MAERPGRAIGSPILREGAAAWVQHDGALDRLLGPQYRRRVRPARTTDFGNNIGVDEVELLLGVTAVRRQPDAPLRSCCGLAGRRFRHRRQHGLGLAGAQVARDLGGVAVTMPATARPARRLLLHVLQLGLAREDEWPVHADVHGQQAGLRHAPTLHQPRPRNRQPSRLRPRRGFAQLPRLAVRRRRTPDSGWAAHVGQDPAHLHHQHRQPALQRQAEAAATGHRWVPPRPIAAASRAADGPGVCQQTSQEPQEGSAPRAAEEHPVLAAGDLRWSSGLAAPWGTGVDPAPGRDSISGRRGSLRLPVHRGRHPGGATIQRRLPRTSTAMRPTWRSTPTPASWADDRRQYRTQIIEELELLCPGYLDRQLDQRPRADDVVHRPRHDPTSRLLLRRRGWNDGIDHPLRRPARSSRASPASLSIAGLAYNPTPSTSS